MLLCVVLMAYVQYTRMLEYKDELATVCEENRQLNLSLTQIVAEVEAKAPVLEAQREEARRAIEAHANVTRQLHEMTAERSRLAEELRGVRADGETYQRAAMRLQQGMRAPCSTALYKMSTVTNSLCVENTDLARQVQLLLKQQLDQVCDILPLLLFSLSLTRRKHSMRPRVEHRPARRTQRGTSSRSTSSHSSLSSSCSNATSS